MHPQYRSKAHRNTEYAQDDSLAQQVEHIPFKDGVLGSNPRRITKRKAKRRQEKDKSYKINILWDFFYCLLATLTATKRLLTDKN